MNILTCPSCGFSSCPIFYGFSLVFPNFDKPKEYKIELKLICTKNQDKIQSIELNQYQKIIELNSQFYNNIFIDENINFDNNMMDYNEIRKEILQKDINNIINQYNNIISTNEKEINNYISNEKTCSEKNIFILKRYLELNNQLFLFMKNFLEIININSSNSLLTSFYYISKIAGYFKYLDDPKFIVQKKILKNLEEKMIYLYYLFY